MHPVAVHRHRHAVGRVGHADRVVGGEPHAHGFPAAVEAAHVAGVDIDRQIRLGDEPVCDHRVPVLGRLAEVHEDVGILRVVAHQALAELGHEVRADDPRELGRPQLPVERVGADQRHPASRDAGRFELGQQRLDRDRSDRTVGRHRRVVECDRDRRARLHQLAHGWQAERLGERPGDRGVEIGQRRGRDGFDVREQPRAVRERRGHGAVAVGQLDVHRHVCLTRSGARPRADAG